MGTQNKNDNKRERGNRGEDLAADFLQREGYEIITRNYICPIGEIDLIAREGNCLVFVEVRSKTSRRFGTPAESITSAKEKRLRKLANYYLVREVGKEVPCRFDLVSIEKEGSEYSLNHIKGMFT